LRLYLGYPHCVGREGKFKLKDNFLKEIGVDYSSVPVEVKKKLLSLLDNLEKRDYLFIKEVFYDAIDIVEFALFTVEVREYADSLGTDVETAKQKGMDEMSMKFQEMGSEVYVEADKINA